MSRIFIKPFCENGERLDTIEERLSNFNKTYVLSGLEYSKGFTEEYQYDLRQDPKAKVISRVEMNQLFYDITEGLGYLQKHGVDEWQAEFSPYGIGDCVRYNVAGGGGTYLSLVSNNTSKPGSFDETEGKWVPLVDMCKNINSLIDRASSLEKRTDSIEDRLNKIDTALTNIVSDYTQQINELTIQMGLSNSSLQNQINKLTETDNYLQNQISNLGQNVTSLQNQINKLGETDNYLQDQISNLGQNAGSLQNQINGLGQTDTSLQNQINSLGQTNSSLQNQINSLSQTDNSLQNQINTVSGVANDALNKAQEATQNSMSAKWTDKLYLQLTWLYYRMWVNSSNTGINQVSAKWDGSYIDYWYDFEIGGIYSNPNYTHPPGKWFGR